MPEREMDLEQCETEEREQVNLRILSGCMAMREKKGEQAGKSQHKADLYAAKYVKKKKLLVWMDSDETTARRTLN